MKHTFLKFNTFDNIPKAPNLFVTKHCKQTTSNQQIEIIKHTILIRSKVKHLDIFTFETFEDFPKAPAQVFIEHYIKTTIATTQGCFWTLPAHRHILNTSVT